MTSNIDPTFEALYGDQSAHRIVPWDIGGPQPVVQQLVAFGAVRGEVLDPGTGPGYHAIHFASHGYSATGIDGSPAAIELAKRNAERAGVQVNFQVADATRLDGFEARFDTVVDSAFYHVLTDDEDAQGQYIEALHKATKPGARLFMFEFSRHNVNGIEFEGVPADNFERVLGAAGWRVDYVGASTYVGIFGPETLAFMTAMMESRTERAQRFKELQDRLRVIEPLLDDNHRVHMPAWAVAATRRD
ncbi:class I SAM-dependent methyltransferase [Mycobacterium sp. 663a-19]|uniref:class I SAM-dependent methyltransferase n=1 Tax=Mycobacterium sp. 663a-19 TaxID=2986148 RepID=UPI002D1F6F91|nr:class I SAM-dependent methyltransferase [Mycobacterium sp. 663a-19]MEB3980049.1 class I SAM-dependent methyltransferase [Mycobacterium sp. 663a-19]